MMYTVDKFAGHTSAATRVLHYDDNHMELLSYSTIVLTMTPDGWIHVNGLYSATTRKHIGWFMQSVGSTYQRARDAYNGHMDYNVWTGEVREW